MADAAARARMARLRSNDDYRLRERAQGRALRRLARKHKTEFDRLVREELDALRNEAAK